MQNTSMIHTDYSFLSAPADTDRRQLASCTVSRRQNVSANVAQGQRRVSSVSGRVSQSRSTSGKRRVTHSAGRNLLKKSILAVCMLLTVFALLMITSGTTSAGEEQEVKTKFYTSYDIQQGDTLWSVAEQYMCAEYGSIYDYIDEVRSINHIYGDQLTAGMHICIPYYGITAEAEA